MDGMWALASYSEHWGGPVERANVEWFKREYPAIVALGE
jgi:hypothetical protein